MKCRPTMTDRFVRRGSWSSRCLTDKGIEFVVGRTLKLGPPHASCHVSQEGRRSFWKISNNGLMKPPLACVFDGTCCATDTQGLVWLYVAPARHRTTAACRCPTHPPTLCTIEWSGTDPEELHRQIQQQKYVGIVDDLQLKKKHRDVEASACVLHKHGIGHCHLRMPSPRAVDGAAGVWSQ